MDIDASLTRDADRVRVLVVDDDPAMLEVTVILLSRQGYIVTPFTASKEAITKIKDKPDSFDVVLTDYSMPVINGVELAILIKESEINTPVILVTGKIENIDDRQVAALVSKPYSIKELDEVIKKVINGNGRQLI